MTQCPPACAAISRNSSYGSRRENAKVDFTHFAFGRDFLARIPASPGVYLMRNRGGEVIYVGKADNLRRRVRSYFTTRALKDIKTARIHGQLHSLEFLTCATGVEALLLEMRMIRDFRPPINFQTEIHEQPSRYGNSRNLLLLVPVNENAEVYMVKDGAFVARQSVPLGRRPSKRLSSRIRVVYFGARRSKAAKREDWETEIVARWLAAHKRRLNYVDVDESGDHASVMRRLTCYLMDPDRMARKVYYRYVADITQLIETKTNRAMLLSCFRGKGIRLGGLSADFSKDLPVWQKAMDL